MKSFWIFFIVSIILLVVMGLDKLKKMMSISWSQSDLSNSLLSREIKRIVNYAVTVSWATDSLTDTVGIDPIRKKVTTKFDSMKIAPFVAGAPIVINGNEAIFIGGGAGQNDALIKYDKNSDKMVDIIEGTGLTDTEQTFAAVSIDMNKDGHVDLIVARRNGVYLYLNNGDGTFSKKLILAKKKDTVPLAITVSDYNKDGVPDIYVSQFIQQNKSKFFRFHDKEHSKENTLLKGLKDGTFEDVTKQSGIVNENNTFTSIFTDINNDGHPDLINVNDTGQIGIYKNDNGRFSKVVPYANYGSWMGIAPVDIDNDGDMDYYLSNIGNTIAVTNSSRGNLKSGEVLTHDHILLRNDGSFQFTEVGKDFGINDAGFSWGAVFMDIDLDGYSDLLVAQNFHTIPTQKLVPLLGQRFIYNPDKKKFTKTRKYINPAIGQSPLSVDVDGDGVQDIVWINMIEPVKIYRLKSEGNNYINVRLPDSLEFANSKVTVKSGNKSDTKEFIIGGTGLASDMSNTLQFGLGKGQVDKVTVLTMYGKEYNFNKPKINSTIIVKKLIIDSNNVR